MALSMEEQRILAEIEQHLTSSEPALAARLSTFSNPRPAAALRSRRGVLRSHRVRLLASCVALVVVTVVSLVVYALLPLRATADRGSARATGAPKHPTLTVPHRPSPQVQGATMAPSSR
jgi:Protein of unknown function (DUF3040)